MKKQVKNGAVEEQNKPQPPLITEAALGACNACPSYFIHRPHELQKDGTVKIRCFSAKGMVPAQTGLDSYQQCEVYKQDQRMM